MLAGHCREVDRESNELDELKECRDDIRRYVAVYQRALDAHSRNNLKTAVWVLVLVVAMFIHMICAVYAHLVLV